MPNPDFVLNNTRYEGARILAAGENFGCGSSREHAVWALLDYGFDVVVAPSFADIFYENSVKNGLLPVALSQDTIQDMVKAEQATISLEEQTVAYADKTVVFEIDAYRKTILLEGLDDISITLKHEHEISRFEKTSRVPPIFNM